jgi:opacity protein-like surface antigen
MQRFAATALTGGIAALTATSGLAEGPFGQIDLSPYVGLQSASLPVRTFSDVSGNDLGFGAARENAAVTGLRIGSRLRVELLASQAASSSGVSTSCLGPGKCFDTPFDSESLSILGALWLDLPVAPRITPYIGGGLGSLRTSITVAGTTEQDWAPMSQLGMGLRIGITDHLGLDVGVRRTTRTVRGSLLAATGLTSAPADLRSITETAALRVTFEF